MVQTCEICKTMLREELSNVNTALADAEERLRKLAEVLKQSGLYEEVRDIFEEEIIV